MFNLKRKLFMTIMNDIKKKKNEKERLEKREIS
jgi:hypothetical protein